MKLNLIIAASALCLAGACATGNHTAEQNADATQATLDIRGQWRIENIVFADTDYVRPSEQVPEAQQFFLFTDSTYSIRTNCNTMFGWYTLEGDTIVLGDGAMTEMACDNMATEDAIRRIFPDIRTVGVENDTVMRLNGTADSEYILLVKMPHT